MPLSGETILSAVAPETVLAENRNDPFTPLRTAILEIGMLISPLADQIDLTGPSATVSNAPPLDAQQVSGGSRPTGAKTALAGHSDQSRNPTFSTSGGPTADAYHAISCELFEAPRGRRTPARGSPPRFSNRSRPTRRPRPPARRYELLR